jgi:hypothetical protein
MSPVSKMDVENTLKSYNRFLNCLDIGKDAYIAPRESERVLSNKEHGAFLEQEVLPLFNFDKLTANEKGFVGIGPISKGDFDKIYNKFAREFGFDGLNTEQLFSLRFDANGNDLRRNHMNIAFDCGDGPDKLFTEYTLVITPGSILDPGLKSKNHKTIYDAPIKEESSISEGVLKDLDLSRVVKSIKFTKPRGGKYEVEINTYIPGYTDNTYTFDKQTYKPDDAVFQGNNIKNAFIKEHWENPAKLSDIKMYVLAKGLGDTMQAVWLKQAIDKSGDELPMNETAMLTSDKILWLRCLIHDVPCIHMNKGVPTLYQREGNGIDINSFKTKHIKNLEAKSRAVINDVKKFCRVVLHYRVRIIISGSGELETKDHPQRKELSYFGEALVTRLENKLKIDIKDAQEKVVGPTYESKKQYMDFVDERTMVSPFCNVNEAKNMVTFRAPSYKGIYPKSKDDKNIPIDIEYLYRKLKSKTDIVEEDYAKIFGDNTGLSVYKRIKGQAMAPKINMAGGLSLHLEDVAAVFSANKDVPGFIPYFCLTQLYELIYIGYAYALALNVPTGKYKTLFDGETMEKIRAPFGKLGLDMLYEVDGNSTEYHELFSEILQIVKMAYTSRNNLCIFNVITPDIKWFMTRLHVPPHPTIRKEVHLLALEYYQALYEAEFSMISTNERHMKNPTDEIVHVTPILTTPSRGMVTPPRGYVAPARPLTPNLHGTRKRSRSRSGSVSSSGNSGRHSMKRLKNLHGQSRNTRLLTRAHV